MNYLITDIARNIQVVDNVLNNFINNYLNGRYYNGEPITVQQWRLDNYKQLRKWAYPKIEEYNDAQVKLNSGISELEQQGQEQLNKYIQDCLDIKTRFPKG